MVGRGRRWGAAEVAGLRALLVEDDPEDAARIAAAVTASGAVERLVRVADRAAAMGALACEPFDLLLVDLNLPDSQGLATVDAFVRARPELPLVVVSGFGGDDLVVAAEALRRGAQDFLAKDRLQGLDLERPLVLARARKRGERERLAAQGRDPLTGLPDLAAFRCMLERARLRALRHGHGLGLALVAVADFWQRLRDWGEAWGAMLERALAAALHGAMRRTDALARVAPGHYALLLEEVRDEAALSRALTRIRARTGEELVRRAGEALPLEMACLCLGPHEPVVLELLLAQLRGRLRPWPPGAGAGSFPAGADGAGGEGVEAAGGCSPPPAITSADAAPLPAVASAGSSAGGR